MKTRLLESKAVVRNTVDRAQFVRKEGNSLLFKAKTFIRQDNPIYSYMGTISKFIQTKETKKQYNNEGIIRIDIVSDNVIRIRYNEGESVKENATPMVVGTLKEPSKLDVNGDKRSILVSTQNINIKVNTKKYCIEICDINDIKLCGIGGPEKNYFRVWDAYNTGICYDKSDKSPIAVECFDLDHHEAIYGFGEKFTRLNKTGQTVDLVMKESLGVTTPRSYKNVPFFVSTKGYGVFFNHSSLMTCWVGSMSSINIQVAIEDDFLDYYVIIGNIKEVLSQYTDITGKGIVPPKWTFGYWQSKISYESAEETLEIAKNLREAEIPCDVIHLDTHWFKVDWLCDLELDKKRFPNPKQYFEDLAKLGFKVSLWQLPYIPEGSEYFDELKAAGGFVKNKEGYIYDTGRCMTPGFKGVVGCIDFTNPKAVDIYQKYIRKVLKLGAKAIKTDFGEDAPIDGIYYDGTPGHQMHNLYPLLYNKAAAEVTKEVTGGVCAWSRSAWAGNQRYPVHWGGDSSANWENMIPQIEGGLSFGLSGFQFWSQDIGGFLMDASKDNLLIRWMQVGLFHSHSRIHGQGVRELYKFPPEVLKICLKYIKLRYRLLPYIYGAAFVCVEKSLPMTRALVIEYQDDPNVWNIGNEFMFGDSLLVAPITDESNSRSIYLPHGTWTDWWSGERIQGNCWINVKVDMETLPLYIREGGIIPMGPIMNYVDEFKTGEIILRISMFEGNGKSTFSVPVNDEIVLIEYDSSNGKHTVKIGKTSVSFKVEILGKENKNIKII